MIHHRTTFNRIRLRRILAGLAVLAAVASAPTAALAQVDGMSYTLTPTYNAIRWDKDLGLDDTELYGAKFALNFGKYIALQSYYLARNDVRTDFSTLSLRDLNGDPLMDQKLNIANYGADVVLNLGDGNIVPFLKGGGGIIRFDPENGNKVSQINAKAGGGFRFGVSRLQAEVYVEDSAFRINRYDLASGEKALYPEDPDADKIKHNLSAGVGVNFLLGGYRGDALSESDQAVAERFRSGLSGLSIPFEPFVGRLDWNDKTGTDNQELFGARTGLDFGRFFGLRGYYWRGVNGDFNKTQPIESFGGEAQFNLSSGKGVVPYLVGGIGQINYTENGDGKNEETAALKDKTALILGGGLSFRLGDRLRLNAAARDYIMSMDALEDIATTDNLQSNWLFSASLGFNLFGHGPDGQKGFFAKGEPPAPPAPTPVSAPATPEPAAPAAKPAAPAAPTAGATTPPAATPAPAPAAPAKMAKPGVPGSTSTETVTPGVIPPVRNYAGDRIIAIPVPVEGEIYIRYGQPGGVNINSKNQSSNQPAASDKKDAKDTGEKKDAKKNDDQSQLLDPEELRSIIREELAQSEAADFGGLTSEQQMELLERRLDERLEARVNQRVNERLAAAGAAGSESPSTIIVSGSGDKPETIKVDADGNVETIDSGSNYKWSFRGYRFFSGVGIDDPEQFVLGTRINLGPLTENSKFHLVPELSFGFGSDLTSTMIAANLQWDFKTVSEKGDWSPYISTGPAWLNFSGDEGDGSDLYLNAAYGLTYDLGRFTGFAEHQGIGFFDHNRILAGLKFKL